MLFQNSDHHAILQHTDLSSLSKSKTTIQKVVTWKFGKPLINFYIPLIDTAVKFF